MDSILQNLLDGVLIHKEQPYVIYFRYQKHIYESSNGLGKVDPKEVNFRLASVTKQFIAYTIIDLVNKGKLSFDTKISAIYPSFPPFFESITIQNLLSHTSGIYDYEDFLEEKYQDHQLQDEDILVFLEETDGTYFTPGSKYRYSNTAYILLGLIITKITGERLEDYIPKIIFNPLDMTTSVVNIEGKTKIKTRALGHILVNGVITTRDQYWCSATIGDGGLYSNINDLIKWLNFLKENESHLKDTMFKKQISTDGKNSYYGMGMRIIELDNNTIYTHSGSTIGTNTLIAFSPKLDFELIFLTNLGPTSTEHLKENLYQLLKQKG